MLPIQERNALLLKSRSLMDANDLAGARALLLELLNHDVRDEEALYGLAVIAERAGARQEGIERLNELLKHSPQHAQARESLARLQRPEVQPPVAPETLRFTGPAEIGIVRGLVARSEVDPDFPLLQSFERPSVHTYVFELVREGQPSLSVQMRGAKLDGLPPRNDDWIAIPAQPNVHGRYEIDRFERLSQPQELVIMQPRGEQVALKHRSTVAKFQIYWPYVTAAGFVVGLIGFVLFVVLVWLPGWREAGEPPDRIQERIERGVEDAQQRPGPDRREIQELIERERRRFERERGRGRDEFRQLCLASGVEESFCNRGP